MFGADFLLFRTDYLPLAAFKFQRECYILRNAHALREVICLGHTFPLGKVCGFFVVLYINIGADNIGVLKLFKLGERPEMILLLLFEALVVSLIGINIRYLVH